MTTLGKTIIIVSLLAIAGCSVDQVDKADRIITDTNEIVMAVDTLSNETPVGMMLPAAWKIYAALAAGAVSTAVNIWQKVKGDLLKKTTKAIVQGIEANTEARATNPTDPIKASIQAEMMKAGVFDQANLLVDKMKLGII